MNDHAHHHPTPKNFGRSFAIGIGLNLAFVIAEIVYGLRAHSLSLLADAGHNVSDVLGLVMAWAATCLARFRASDRYTYGLQSASIFASLANSLLLLVAVGGIGWEAFVHFNNPEPPATTIVMIVAAIGVAVNGITAWLFHGNDHDMNIHAAFVHMAGDAAISAGVVLAGFAIMETGWLWLDPLMSLLIIVFIVASTWKLLTSSTNLALHAVPENVELPRVKGYLASLPGVTEIHDLHVWAMSTTGIAMSAHLVMPTGHPGDAFLVKIGHTLEHDFSINHATIQIELGDGHCHTGCVEEPPEHDHDHHEHHH